MPYNVQVYYDRLGPDTNRGGDMLRIHGLSGTQKEARTAGSWIVEARGEARKARTQITYRIILFLLGVALLMKSYSVEPNLVDVLQISGLLTAVAGITLIITYVVGKKTLTPV